MVHCHQRRYLEAGTFLERHAGVENLKPGKHVRIRIANDRHSATLFLRHNKIGQKLLLHEANQAFHEGARYRVTPSTGGFPWVGYGLTGICADGLSLFRPLDSVVCVLRFSNQSPIRDPMPVASVTEWRSAPGSLLPEERSPVLPGSLEADQDNRDIVDAPSVVVVPMPRGS